jgi:hypothetical protein
MEEVKTEIKSPELRQTLYHSFELTHGQMREALVDYLNKTSTVFPRNFKINGHISQMTDYSNPSFKATKFSIDVIEEIELQRKE